MRLALFGGTFDQIHAGHLILAREARETLGLDEVIFIPAALSPHKLDTAPTPPSVRWAMLCAAVAGEPGFRADDLELHRPGPSFTFDTVMEYRRRYPQAELFYFIGQDHLAKLPTWHRIDELRQMVTLIVLGRAVENAAAHEVCISRRIDISATDIRNRVAKGLSIRYLVPEQVADLIQKHHLYLESPTSLGT